MHLSRLELPQRHLGQCPRPSAGLAGEGQGLRAGDQLTTCPTVEAESPCPQVSRASPSPHHNIPFPGFHIVGR